MLKEIYEKVGARDQTIISAPGIEQLQPRGRPHSEMERTRPGQNLLPSRKGTIGLTRTRGGEGMGREGREGGHLEAECIGPNLSR